MSKSKELKNVLETFKKEEIISFAVILYEKFVLKKDSNYTKVSNAVLGLLGVTIGISYKNLHPTAESQLKEPYNEWITKMAKTIIKL